MQNGMDWYFYKRKRDFVQLSWDLKTRFTKHNDVPQFDSTRYLLGMRKGEAQKRIKRRMMRFLQAIMNDPILNRCDLFVEFMNVPQILNQLLCS